MKNLSLGLKISLGFALLILIAAALGLMAVWNMNTVGRQSKMLAQEYIPEVDVAVELRGAANRLMYEMRGYGLSEDQRYYDNAQAELEAIGAAIDKAKKLEAVSPNLKKLKGQIQAAEKAVGEYRTLIEETKATSAKLAANRKTLDSAALTYMDSADAFLQGQNEKFKTDLEARQEKLRVVGQLVNTGALVRVTNFKAQAMNDQGLLAEAINQLTPAFPLLTTLKEVSRNPENIRQIEAITSAAKGYQAAMKLFLAQWKERGNAGSGILNNTRRQMDANAAAYVTNCDRFLESQQSQLSNEMAERNRKINLVTQVVNLGNATRVGAFKAQALRDAQMMQDAMENFKKIGGLLGELKEITRLQEDLKRIDQIHGAGNTYNEAMAVFLENWHFLQQLGPKREAAGAKVIGACIATADAGMEATDRIAKGAQDSLATSSRVMIIGLIAALAIGVIGGFLITRSITKPINRIISGMTEGANQVASAATQVSSSSQSMAEGASQQAASIEETSSSMEEMASMTKKNAENAGNADLLMREANQVVGTANDAMVSLNRSMEDITKASEETSKIIKTIDEIAFQTNLLALNAAVEAARAGEAGAGFAVVADEVRNLAMRAADAAKDTAELIEGTVKKVTDGSEIVAETNSAFTQVADSSEKVGLLVSEISDASKEQSSGIEQVNTAISEMDKVVQQNAANAEESASASEEMSAQAEQLKEFVDDLVSLVTGKNSGSSGYRVSKTLAAPKPLKPVAEPGRLPGKNKGEIRPEQVIPFDDDEFADF